MKNVTVVTDAGRSVGVFAVDERMYLQQRDRGYASVTRGFDVCNIAILSVIENGDDIVMTVEECVQTMYPGWFGNQ